MDALQRLKLLCLETAEEGGDACTASLSPRMFSDAALRKYLELYKGDVDKTAYNILKMKAQSTKASIAGMDLPEQQNYYLRLANSVRPNAGRAVGRADET